MSAKPIPEPPAERRAVSQQRRSADQQLLYQANLVENVNDAILAAELDLRLTHWNRAAEQIYGWKAGEVLGRYGPDVLGTVIPGRSRAEVYEELWRCGHWSGEAVQRRKDGSRVHIEARMLALYDADGSIVGLVTVNRDITERKRAEEALAESERKFRAVAEMAPAAVCVFDGRKFVYANASAERILGYPRAELLSMDPRRLVHPDFLPEVEARALARLRGEVAPSRYELRVLRKDGSVGWVEMSAGLIKWDGRPASLGIAYDITERKQAERELRTSRDLLRAVTEGTLDVIFVKDLRGHYLMMNPAGARHLGLSPEAVVGRHDSEFFGPESARCFREQESGVVRTGEARTFEYPLTYPDATTRTFLSVKAPARDESGQIVGIIGVAHDITERKRAETALAENERRFRELAQTAPTAIFVYDGSRIVYANPATEEITGYSREELLVLDPHEMVHPDFRGQVKARAVARLRGEAVPGRYELPMLRRDGTTRWVDLSARVLKFDSKPAILVIAYDITDRKRAEEAALMAEMKYRAIFEQSVVGNFQSTPEGRFLMVNQAMARMYGYDSPGEMTRSVTNIGAQLYTDAKRRTEYRRMLEDLGRVMDFEAEHRRKDGSTFWTSDSTRAVRDAGGRLLYYEGTVQDITARKQAEAALRRLSGRLLTLQDEERRRIARELHDSTAQNLAALIMNLGAAEKGAARMNLKARRALTEGLALAKQSAREIRTLSYLLHPPMLDEFGLAAALRWYVHGFSERSGIRLELEMPRKLRRLPPDVERTLFRITQEALANLRQHSASKRAKVVLRRKNGRVELEVRDYGKGLLANGRHPQRPMGVGLVGMRERVDQLEGQLVIEPAKPKGTRVRVWLPVGMGKP